MSSIMHIPVFVSCPTTLSASQAASYEALCVQLKQLQIEPRSLGRSDFAHKTPLREVLVLARHCSGGLILGFSQYLIEVGVRKPGTNRESPIRDKRVAIPTAWNQIEAALLYSLGIPLLILRERLENTEDIIDGVFDPQVGELFIHDIPPHYAVDEPRFKSVLLRWSSAVRRRYYGDE